MRTEHTRESARAGPLEVRTCESLYWLCTDLVRCFPCSRLMQGIGGSFLFREIIISVYAQQGQLCTWPTEKFGRCL